MVQVTETLAALSPDTLDCFYTTDSQLSNLPLLVFHGPSAIGNSTLNSSRIQLHIFSAAGHQSYPRLTISPNSPFYAAVDQIPRDQQGDEICRGLAFGLLKYFKELPEAVKSALIVQSAPTRGRRPASAPTLFGEQHAANLASALAEVENVAEIIQNLEAALKTQTLSHVDVDLVLPPGSISHLKEEDGMDLEDDGDFDHALNQYGAYAPLVKLFGETVFLPTSKLKRAPSKPTTLNRTKSFLKEQKMSLRREMAELVDTEERYVFKMHELVNHIADEFRSKAKTRTFGSFSPSEKDLQRLFPTSLDQILQINSAFLDAIRKVMDETEEEAMQDLEADQTNYKGSRYGGTGRPKDPTGAVAFAKTLLEWFPQFSKCYQDYIRSSQDFPQIITSFLKPQSSFSQRVQQTGEQRLRSAIIEPVQRLPRYSLFIDNIIKYLPITHPALQPILKARDIITSICSMDSSSTDKSQVVNRLKVFIDQWPSRYLPKGRLISAADIVELDAPYQIASGNSNLDLKLILLFADAVVVLRKIGAGSLSARGLLAEVDKPSASAMMASVTAAAGGPQYEYELAFETFHTLSDVRFTEGWQGRTVWMTTPHEEHFTNNRPSLAASVHVFLLQGPYDGKATKWTEEIAKARVEGRFSEVERESDTWCLRSVNSKENGLNLYTAVFQEGLDKLIEGRKEPAPIRIVVDHQKGTKGAPIGHYGVEIVANLAMSQTSSTYHLEVGGLQDKLFVDSVDTATFIPVFAKRVGDLLHAQYSVGNLTLTAAFISSYSSILKSLRVQLVGGKPKTSRPASPVKMLSSFLNGGGSMSSYPSVPKLPRTPLMGSIPSMLPPAMTRSNSQKGSVGSNDGRSGMRSTPTLDESRPANPLMRLEETFTSYIAALQSRKGNVVGKMLRTRTFADELSVNALYNTFIENPFDMRSSSEVSVDVLFCAFEKFLKMAWTEQMGVIVTIPILNALQEKNSKLFAGDFADFIKVVFADMAPQNKRAFVSIVKLLADLLEGCGNDGDRGILTATFCEILVHDGNPHDYINLLDRMVEDSERIFEDIGPGVSTGYTTPMYGSMASRSTRSANTGSLTSNTSSLRKRFGLDSLLRQNSKTDSDMRPSMWRTLSKNSRNPATGEPTSSSLSKGSLHRSMSIDVADRTPSPRRPMSRDRPTVLGAFDDRPSSSHTQPNRLSTIGASPPPETPGTNKSLKNKRRSSLSDLKALMASTILSSPSSTSPRRMLPQPQIYNSSPRTPSPTKSIMDRTIKIGRDSPADEVSKFSLRHPGNLTERPANILSDEASTVKDARAAGSMKGHKIAYSVSSIPVLKGASKEGTPTQIPALRPTSSPQKSSPQKLRLQSPQKLRERLQNEAKAISATEASFQNELSKIGEEMNRVSSTVTTSTSDSSSVIEIQKLSQSIKAFESRIPLIVKDLTLKHETTRKDLEATLAATEHKVKGLDQLYKETSAENELLYEKFNGELAKIVKAVKGKGKEDKEDLVVKVKEAMDETAKTKKENLRLRRELLSLKSLVKAAE